MNPNYMSNIVGAVTFATIGIVIFVVFFLILDWVTPYDLWKQLCEEKNQALATVVGAATVASASSLLPPSTKAI